MGKYAFNDADFYFSGSKISASGRLNSALPMTARCNVNNPLDAKTDPGWNTLIVGYKGPDGQQANASVVARLVQINRRQAQPPPLQPSTATISLH